MLVSMCSLYVKYYAYRYIRYFIVNTIVGTYTLKSAGWYGWKESKYCKYHLIYIMQIWYIDTYYNIILFGVYWRGCVDRMLVYTERCRLCDEYNIIYAVVDFIHFLSARPALNLKPKEDHVKDISISNPARPPNDILRDIDTSSRNWFVKFN